MSLMVRIMNVGNLAGDSSSAQLFASTSFHNNSAAVLCTEKLDELDQVFDQRRDARTALSSMNINHEIWDWYEPESVCLSEERFGSNQRYMAFGDGTCNNSVVYFSPRCAVGFPFVNFTDIIM
jgi:hypothetical protein